MSTELEHLNRYLRDINVEIASGSERGSVLACVSVLDDLLRRILEARFIGNAKDLEQLLGVDKPLGAFATRIRLCEALALIANDEARALDIIKKVRNDFAHKLGQSLNHEPSRDRCETLFEITNDPGSIRLGVAGQDQSRHDFVRACTHMMMVLNHRLGDASTATREPLKDARPLWERSWGNDP